MQTLVKREATFTSVIQDNPYELLKVLKTLVHTTIKSKYRMRIHVEVLEQFLGCKQKKDQNIDNYIIEFKQHKDVFEEHVGNALLDKFTEGLPEYTSISGRTDVMFAPENQRADRIVEIQKRIKKEVFEAFCAYLLLQNSYQGHYHSLFTKFETEFTLHNDEYPKTMAAMEEALTSYKKDKPPPSTTSKDTKTTKPSTDTETQATSFAQMKPGEYCWICGKLDHKKTTCPDKNTPPHLWVKNLKKNIQHTQAQLLQNQAIAMQAQLMAPPVVPSNIQVPSSSTSTSDGRSGATGTQMTQTQFSSYLGLQRPDGTP